jgi:polyphenol oxidase
VFPVAAGHFPAAPGGRPAFWAATGRSGGCSASPFTSLNLATHVGDDTRSVAANRQVLAQLVNLHADDLAVLNAEHGGRVLTVERPGITAVGDGAVTSRPGIGLAALGADCVTIALASVSGAPVIGVAHCGWKGLGAGIVTATIDAMWALGAAQIGAVLGPSICAECYRVPEDRLEQLRHDVASDVYDAATRTEGSIDVAAGVAAQLSACSVDVQHCEGCTAERDDLFSYRRDGRTGRQGMIIRL